MDTFSSLPNQKSVTKYNIQNTSYRFRLYGLIAHTFLLRTEPQEDAVAQQSGTISISLWLNNQARYFRRASSRYDILILCLSQGLPLNVGLLNLELSKLVCWRN